MHIHKLFILAFGIIVLQEEASAQDYFQKAEAYFKKRSEVITGLKAKRRNVNLAINFYRKAGDDAEAIAGLLRAMEFKGSYTGLPDSKAKKVYGEAIEIGKKYIERYPDHVGVKYYYMTNLGRWGETIGVVTAAKEGVSEQIRELAEKIMEMDPEFADAGAQRILGVLHLKVPDIPMVLSWPSDERAIELLSKAYQTSPDNPANTRLYAEGLIEVGREDEAYDLLKEIENEKPRPEHLLEDKINIDKALKLRTEHFDS